MQSITPVCTHTGLGSSHFARRYFGNRVFFLFLQLLRCFSSLGSLPYVMDWRMDIWGLLIWVSPFGYLRIDGYLLLPAAFRSLSRPSSALSAKASTLRSFLFDLPVLIAFKTGGSLAFYSKYLCCVYNQHWMSIGFFIFILIRYLFDIWHYIQTSFKITPRMSFPISKRLTFFGLFSYMQFSRYTFDWTFIIH